MPLAKRYPWFSQPPSGSAVDSRWARSAKPGFVYSPVNGMRSSLGGELSFARSSSSFSGNRFQAGPGGLGLVLYSNQGGTNDDVLAAPFSIATAVGGDFTSIISFTPRQNGNTAQSWIGRNAGNLVVPSSHVVQLTEGSNAIYLGYYGNNGYNRVQNVTVDKLWECRTTVVISTSPGKEIVAAINGVPVDSAGWGGLVNYVGGGNNPTTGIVTTGDGDYPNYYYPNGLLHLWAGLPGVFLTPGEACQLSAFPFWVYQP